MGWATIGESLRLLGLTEDGAQPRNADAKRAYADYLRANQTPSERMMARVLYHLGIDAEPQVQVRGYIVDFLDRRNGVVIEVDGGIHGDRKAADDLRTANLEDQGYRIIRITNEEVRHLMQSVAGGR